MKRTRTDDELREILDAWRDEEWEARSEPIRTHTNRAGDVFVRLAP